MLMVSYQTFVKLAFDVAKRKGGSFDGIEDGGSFMSDLGAVWSNEKETYKQLTEDQARSRLESMIES